MIQAIERLYYINIIIIEVKDNGIGIPQKDLPYIFERFYKGKKGNFGLGLSISKNIIERLHGGISAENSENGALFLIELPIIENA